jgi:tRNA pseudouridine55 synthase
VVATRDPSGVTREALAAALAARVGEQDQIPPMYSAIKQGGVRLYHRARAGEEVERPPRRVRIDRLELLAFAPGRARIAIACGKGMYVRSLVADLGADLGCGAHVAELRRTRSGAFDLAQAQTFDALDLEGVRASIVPLTRATRLPQVVAPAALVVKVVSGVQLAPDVLAVAPEIYERFQIIDEGGALVAIAHVEGTKVVYDRVFTLDGSRGFPQSAR